MNSINQKQNKEKILSYLFSQRFIYSKCKTLKHITIWISIIVYLSGVVPYISKNFSNLNVIVSSFWVAIVFLLEAHYKKVKCKAVDYQEYVDRYLFEFDINKDVIKDLDYLERESINLRISKKDKYEKSIDPNYKYTVCNWYSDVSALPLEVARIICQNENGRWENRQRNIYSWILGGIILILLALASIKAHIFSESIISLIYVIPVAIEFIKLFADNVTTIKLANEIENRIEEVYRHVELQHRDYDNNYLKEQSLEIQRRIRAYRENSISVPEFLYKFVKPKEQKKSNEFISLKVRQLMGDLYS